MKGPIIDCFFFYLRRRKRQVFFSFTNYIGHMKCMHLTRFLSISSNLKKKETNKQKKILFSSFRGQCSELHPFKLYNWLSFPDCVFSFVSFSASSETLSSISQASSRPLLSPPSPHPLTYSLDPPPPAPTPLILIWMNTFLIIEPFVSIMRLLPRNERRLDQSQPMAVERYW